MSSGLHVQHPLFSPYFNPPLIFSTVFFFRKLLKYQISWKSVQWESSCSMRTDITQKILFSNDANASKYAVIRLKILSATYRIQSPRRPGDQAPGMCAHLVYLFWPIETQRWTNISNRRYNRNTSIGMPAYFCSTAPADNTFSKPCAL